VTAEPVTDVAPAYSDAQIAQVCHEANRAVEQLHVTAGDRSIKVGPAWWQLEEPARVRAIAMVAAARRGATAEQLHQEWCDALTAEGWRCGPVKDPVAKTHPNLRVYSLLSAEQRRKDHLFAAIVGVMSAGILVLDAAEVRSELEAEDDESPIVVTREELTAGLPDHLRSGAPRAPQRLGTVYVDVVPRIREGALDGLRAQLQQSADSIRAESGGKQDQSTPFDVAIDRAQTAVEALRVPQVGDRVHYVAHGTPIRKDGTQEFPPACRAAIVTQTDGTDADLFVMNPTGVFLHPAGHDSGCEQALEPGRPVPPMLCGGLAYRGGTWHWSA
jgi:hypothetical protein